MDAGEPEVGQPPTGVAGVGRVAAMVGWKRGHRLGWRPSVLARAGVLEFDKGMLSLFDRHGAEVFSVPVQDVSCGPVDSLRFALLIGGQEYVVNGLYAQAAQIRRLAELAKRREALFAPPNLLGTAEAAYRRWVTGSTWGVGMGLNAAPQRRLWQRFWLELLRGGGARRLADHDGAVPEDRGNDLAGAPRRPGRGIVVLSLVLALVPLLTLGFFAWVPYVLAAVWARRRWLWIAALTVLVLDGLYWWLVTAVSSDPENGRARPGTRDPHWAQHPHPHLGAAGTPHHRPQRADTGRFAVPTLPRPQPIDPAVTAPASGTQAVWALVGVAEPDTHPAPKPRTTSRERQHPTKMRQGPQEV